jgi:hypothetical protein
VIYPRTMAAGPDSPDSVCIGFPVKCVYRGGHRGLGSRGKHFRIEDGKIGYGEFSLSHSLPLSAVSSVEVTEQDFGGSEATTLVSVGTMKLGSARGGPASSPRQVTLITVRTRDGQEPVWEVEHRGADWVRGKLTPVLSNAGIRYYDDLPPQDRGG